MKIAMISVLTVLLAGCSITDNGIIIDKPTVPQVNICENVATNDDVVNMKEQIDAQAFKDERMDRARFVTKGYCFLSSQVVSIMESMVFADAKLEIAKDLHDQTTDRKNYNLCVDALTHKSDRDELKAYMAANP